MKIKLRHILLLAAICYLLFGGFGFFGILAVPAGVAETRYACDGRGNCIPSANGTFTSSDCDGVCSGLTASGSYQKPPQAEGSVGPGKYNFDLPNPIGVTNFQDLINIIGKWIFNLAIPIAVIVIIYAGVLMLTAGGVPARFQKGAKALWYAVLGLAVVLIGKGFVTLVQSILSLRNK